MSKMKISDLSPKEKLQFEKEMIGYRETVGVYWRIAILLLFWPMIDLILTIITPFFGEPHCFGPFPEIPFFPILESLCVFSVAFGFAWSWILAKWQWEDCNRKWVAALIIILWSGWFTYTMVTHYWVKDTLPRQIIATAEFLVFLGVTVFLAIKVKWPRFIWIVLAYLGLLLFLFYGFYHPMCPPSECPPPHDIGLLNTIQIPEDIIPYLGIVLAIIMAILSFEKVQRRLALQEVLKQRGKKRK